MPAPFVAYADMVGDLFHAGHVSFLKKVRAAATERAGGREVHLVVGVMADEDASSYKRKPVLTLAERAGVIAGCRYVDEVLAPCPAGIDDAFLDAAAIDLVVHGDDFDDDASQRWYAPAIRRGIFVNVPYSVVDDGATSTTDIISRLQARAQ